MSKEEDDELENRGRLEPSSGPYKWLASFHHDLMAGAVMGGVVHTIVAPIERSKFLLQTKESNLAIVAGGRRKFKGMLDCIFRTVREEGILSLWRGKGSSVLRHYPSVALNFSLKGMIVHRGLYFGGLDTIKEILSEESKTELALWKRWVVAQAVTTSAGLLSYPLDTVRRRMMMQSGLEQPMYRSTLDCRRTIYRTEGVPSILPWGIV
ncbi:hypothetical protein CRYUN_Cryun03dG0031600 [Craigia yunnanensis]